jgi:uncharacterized protein (TIGR02646 family)
VKYIQKDSEPESFATWKNRENDDWKPTFRIFQNPGKKEVHCGLIREQGHICCYCQSPITRPTSHIEHFRPQSTHSTNELEYSNLLASCNCGEKHPGLTECDEPASQKETEDVAVTLPRHCGQFKGDWYEESLVSPLDPECETYFSYGELTGKIKSSNDPEKRHSASVTIERLALNSRGLLEQRQQAFDAALQSVEDWSDADAKRLIEGFKQKDERGRFVPFCAAIVSVLDKYFPRND